MSDIDSSRVFEISELTPATTPLDGGDKTLVSRAGRSAPALLSDLYAWVKGQTDDVYVQPPSQLTAAALPLAGTEKALLSQGSNNVCLLLNDLYAWVKAKTDLLYSKLPDTSSKGGQVLVVAADGVSFVWSGATSGPLLSGVVLSGNTSTGSTGAGATRAISGNGRSGQLTITTGTATSTLAANASLATISFATAFPAAPRVFITPANANAARLTTPAYVSSTTTSAFVLSNTAALTASQAYVWNFLVEL